MIIIFILVGGMIVKCALGVELSSSYCTTVDFKTFGALASAGVLELIFELRGLIAVFQKKSKNGDKDK